jgi:hypothetical protein
MKFENLEIRTNPFKKLRCQLLLSHAVAESCCFERSLELQFIVLYRPINVILQGRILVLIPAWID